MKDGSQGNVPALPAVSLRGSKAASWRVKSGICETSGRRREESTARSRTPTAKRDERLTRARNISLAWNPLIHWPRADQDHLKRRGWIASALSKAYNDGARRLA